MRGATGMSRAPANVPPAGAGPCPPWLLSEIARAYQRAPTAALGALLERLRRGPAEYWAITPAGRAALDEEA